MKIIESITLSPKTVGRDDPGEVLFFSVTQTSVIICKKLAHYFTEPGIVIFKKQGVIYIKSDPEGFMMTNNGSCNEVNSRALIRALVDRFDMKLKTRYYVRLSLDGYKVVSSGPTRANWQTRRAVELKVA